MRAPLPQLLREGVPIGLDDLTGLVFDESLDGDAQNQSDSLEALKSLGYSEREAREALKKVPKDITDTGECVKRALKILSKSK